MKTIEVRNYNLVAPYDLFEHRQKGKKKWKGLILGRIGQCLADSQGWNMLEYALKKAYKVKTIKIKFIEVTNAK
jgi:hypothetical protein